MPYVKSTVHISRLAQSALKSFTHGYAQTVVAASQTSYAAHNAPAGGLADSLIGQFRKSKKGRVQNGFHPSEVARQASTSAVSSVRPVTSHQPEPGLKDFSESFQKHQRNEVKELQQFQYARRVGWQPPTTVPVKSQEAADVAEIFVEEESAAFKPSLKRSYTTSAIDNFGKAFVNDEAAEAVALEQVNIAIAEEIQRSKDDADVAARPVSFAQALEGAARNHSIDDGVAVARRASLPDASPRAVRYRADHLDDVVVAARPASVPEASAGAIMGRTDVSSTDSAFAVSTPASSFTTAHFDSAHSDSSSDASTAHLLDLFNDKRYQDVVATCEDMARTGTRKLSTGAYQMLMLSTIKLSDRATVAHTAQLRVHKALEIYNDMLKSGVAPDTTTYSVLIQVLSSHASDVVVRKESLEVHQRYSWPEVGGKFMLASTQSEFHALDRDSSLALALTLFERANKDYAGEPVYGAACAALLCAASAHGLFEEMLQIYQYMQAQGFQPRADVYLAIITAFGARLDLCNVVEYYDEYKNLAIANDAGENSMDRNDHVIYAQVIKAYRLAGKMDESWRFFSKIETVITDKRRFGELTDIVVAQALVPVALMDPTYRAAFELSRQLGGKGAVDFVLENIATTAADKDLAAPCMQAFNQLAQRTQDLAAPSMAILAMHVRNANVELTEPFWRILESAPATIAFIQPTTMRAAALVRHSQAGRGLVESRRMFARIRDNAFESRKTEALEQIDEAIEHIGKHMFSVSPVGLPEGSIELLRTMVENGRLVQPLAVDLVARFGPESISRLDAANLEFLLRVQAGMIFDESLPDIAGPARFGSLLQNIVSHRIVVAAETEDRIEKTLVNINNPGLSQLWNNYRYPQPSTMFTPAVPVLARVYDDSVYDPYIARTDVKGSNAIHALLDRPDGRHIREAMEKFRNMRRIDRYPLMYTYGKLIEALAKDGNLVTAKEVFEMAKQDVPLDMRFKVVRHGWQQILDHMIAGCLTLNRRDMASAYHKNLTDMGGAPSANTFGIYITTLKANTQTFDEASEAVTIFQRALSEGVQPTSFLYNALIGKLGRARRIDDTLRYFSEMTAAGIVPTSVTYGTVINALCRVSSRQLAEDLFDEMEGRYNYRPRPAPYHSMMQFFLNTQRDRSKVLAYYERMRARGIQPTAHTWNLLINTHATLEPVDMPAAEAVLREMQAAGHPPAAEHHASLIKAQGCVLHDLAGAQARFAAVLADSSVRPQPCLYQAMFEALNVHHRSAECEPLVADMGMRGVEFTPYIANALIAGWRAAGELGKAREVFARLPAVRREPTTYEAMVRAELAAGETEAARAVVREAQGRGYPALVVGKIAELVR